MQNKLPVSTPDRLYLPRPALSQKLLACSQASQLLVLQAPAGYGKTQALAALFQALMQQQQPVQQLVLVPQDVAPQDFVKRLVVLAGPQLQDGGMPIHTFLVDDFDRWPQASAAWLSQVMNALPGWLHLVIGTRSLAQEGLMSLHVRGLLTVLDAGVLRFSSAEIASFCRTALPASASHLAEEAIQYETEGWPALLGLLLDKATAPLQRPNEALASTDYRIRVRRYLAEEIFAPQSASSQQFVTQVGILGEVSDALCNVVCQRDDSDLASLAASGWPLSPLMEGWYRFHPALTQYLSASQTPEQRQQSTTRRNAAADWLIAHGKPGAAIPHLVEIQDWEKVMPLLAPTAQALLYSARFWTVIRWSQRLPRHILFQDGSVCISYIWCLFFVGEMEKAISVLRDLKTHMRGMFDPLIEQTIRLQELLLTEHHLHDPHSFVDGITQLTPVLAGSGNTNRGRLYNLIALTEIGKGEMNAATEAVWQAKKINREVGNLQALCVSYFFEASILAAKGDLNEALGLLQCADEIIESQDAKMPVGLMHLFCSGYRLQLLYELGRYAEARHWLDQYRRINTPEPIALSTFLFGVMDARLAFIERGSMAAVLVLEKLAHRLAQDQTIQHKIEAELARVAIAGADQPRAALLIRQALTAGYSLPEDAFIHPTDEIEGCGIETARLLLHAGGEQASAAMHMLAAQMAGAQRAGRHWRLTKLHLLCTVGYLLAQNTSMAQQHLLEAVHLATANGVVSSFLDEGPLLSGFLKRLSVRSARLFTQAEQLHIARILNARGQVAAPVHLVELNAREQEILRLVADGLTSGIIATRLDLSLQTIKWYLKGIYAKLGVGNRVSAVDKARRLGLI